MLSDFTNAVLMPAFDENTSEDEIARFVDEVKRHSVGKNLLADLLPERNPVYKGKGTNQIIRLRGYILSAFGKIGLPDKALPYVFDELESGTDAYLIAAAAIALRGLPHPSTDSIPYLFKTITNIQYNDDSITFDDYKPHYPLSNPTTALTEIFKTFGWMGGFAETALPQLQNLCESEESDFTPSVRAELEKAIVRIKSVKQPSDDKCCSISMDFRIVRRKRKLGSRQIESFENIEFQDENGDIFKYKNFFSQKPSIVVFFYTRCNNPNRCSLTITKLGWLQKMLIEQGLENDIKTAAITYDPEYDKASRLKAYGRNRQVLFTARNKFLRTTKGFEDLQSEFQLGVNFVNSIVNKHRIELYILNSEGKVAVSFLHLHWDIQEVIAHAKLLLTDDVNNNSINRQPLLSNQEPRLIRKIYQWMTSILMPLFIVFFPKCPICWAAYLSLFGITGLKTIPYSPWLLPVFILLMLVNLFSLYRRAKAKNKFFALYLSFAGVLSILIPGGYFEFQYAAYFGLILIFIGSLMSVLSFQISSDKDDLLKNTKGNLSIS